MAGVMDIIVRARDEATAVMERIGDVGEQAGAAIDKAWIPATAALTAAGAGLEALARRQQDQNISLRQMAARLGESEDSVRSWATEVSNAGFPLADVTALMDLASKRGIEGRDALQGYATFWDDVGDATGQSAPALAAAAVGLQGIGIAAGAEGEALDALGFIMDNTTAGVSEFLSFVSRTGPQLRDMGVDVNDTAAIFGVLENELGLTGRVARTQFNAAVSESDGTLAGMLDTLGISAEQFAAWRTQVEGAGAAVTRNAQIADDAMTPLQELQATLGDLAFSFAPVIEGAAGVAPILIAIGPATKLAREGMQLMARMGPLLGAAMHAALGPIGLVTGAVALLAAGFATDFLGMRTRLETDVNDMSMNFGTMGDKVHALADRAGGDFQAMKERIKAEMEETGDSFEAVVHRIEFGTHEMLETEKAGWAAYGERIAGTINAAGEIVETGVEGMAADLGGLPEKAADELLAAQFHLTDAVDELLTFMDTALSPAEEMFNARAFLASKAYRDALEDDRPEVRKKAQEMAADAAAVLARTEGFYGGGRSAGIAWGNGLRSAKDWARLMAWELAASANPALHGRSPPKEGPLSDIDVGGLNVGMSWAEGLFGAAFYGREKASALAGEVADVLGQDFDGVSIPVSMGEGAFVSAGLDGPSSLGGVVHYHTAGEHVELNVNGARQRDIESVDDILDRLVELELYTDGRLER